MDLSKEEIHKIRKAKSLDDKLLKYKGVIGVDVDHKQVKGQKTDKIGITVYVKKKVGKEELQADETLPTHIEGILSDVVECPNVWPSSESSQQLAAQVKPEQLQTPVLAGGLSISNQYNLQGYGTLGVVLVCNNTPTALSCAHVMVHPPPNPGQIVIEPGGPQGGTYPADSIGACTFSRYGQGNVDAALVPIEGRASHVGYVINVGNVNGYGVTQVGEIVIKMGVTTGLTMGVIGSTTLTWSYTTALGQITLYNQIRVDNIIGQGNFGMPGDSGSAVINNNSMLMVGMVVSGNPGHFTVCNTSTDLAAVIPTASSFVMEEEKAEKKQ